MPNRERERGTRILSSLAADQPGLRGFPPLSPLPPPLDPNRLKAERDGLLWIELRPGLNSHQSLRPLCAEVLGCPVVGDPKLGSRSPPSAHIALDEHLHLHARSLVVRFVRQEDAKLAVTAPLPKHMARLWDRFGWDHAVTNYRKE
mmetsp:Transcript_14374/g.34053  ORF Transcript_14374/g.34053 Transcript_14374/m.34053 type:complete len:146 (-) Transcript_14374:187-624(-)